MATGDNPAAQRMPSAFSLILRQALTTKQAAQMSARIPHEIGQAARVGKRSAPELQAAPSPSSVETTTSQRAGSP